MFQADIEVLQTVEQRLKEETTALQELNAQLEFEKNEVFTKLNASTENHNCYVAQTELKMQMGSKTEALKVNLT